MIYRWRAGSHQSLDAQVVGEHLEGLRQMHGGLTARLVLDDAKAETSPTHDAFEWDDAKAADEWRLEQARHLISHVVVVVRSDGKEEQRTRAFVVVTENGDNRYESISVVREDPALRQQVLLRALREYEALERKYREYEELLGIFKAVAKVKKKFA